MVVVSTVQLPWQTHDTTFAMLCRHAICKPIYGTRSHQILLQFQPSCMLFIRSYCSDS